MRGWSAERAVACGCRAASGQLRPTSEPSGRRRIPHCPLGAPIVNETARSAHLTAWGSECGTMPACLAASSCTSGPRRAAPPTCRRSSRSTGTRSRAGSHLPEHPHRQPLRGGARPDRGALGRPARGRPRPVGGPGRRGPQGASERRPDQPRDPRPRRTGPGRPAMAAFAGRRGAPGPDRARPRPADPRGVAGERQAPRPAVLRQVHERLVTRSRRTEPRPVVLAGPVDPGRAHPLGQRPRRRTGSTWSRCRRRVDPRDLLWQRFAGVVGLDPGAAYAESTDYNPRSASSRRRASAGSTS